MNMAKVKVPSTFRYDSAEYKEILENFAPLLGARSNVSVVINALIRAIEERPKSEVVGFLNGDSLNQIVVPLSTGEKEDLQDIAKNLKYASADHFATALIRATLGKSLEEITEFLSGASMDIDSQRIQDNGGRERQQKAA